PAKDDSTALKNKPDSTIKAKQGNTPKDALKFYLHTSYREMESEDSVKLDNFIDAFSKEQLIIMLPKYPFRLCSYFWLNQNWVYLEIVFWCLFGVFCNLLYHTSENIKNRKFKKTEVYVQIAKLFYSPFCVIIIYSCYNKINSGQEYDLQYSVNSIVVAFLLGFFSGRMIDLLNRIKDILLPLGKGSSDTESPTEDLPNATEEIIQEAIQKKGGEWVNSFPNVTGFSVRNKISEGKDAGIPALIFKVQQKEDVQFGNIPEEIPYESANGKKYKIITDVVLEKIPKAHFAIKDSSPFELGISISREDDLNNFGTVGLLLEKNNDSSHKKYLISCYHVFCSNELMNNNKSFSPNNSNANLRCAALKDDGTNIIGSVIQGELSSEFDFAIAKINDGFVFKNNLFNSNIIPSGFKTLVPEDKGKSVKICGRTSEHVTGEIISHFASQTIDYGNGITQFLNGLIELTPLSKGGDSGAAVLNEKNEVLGLIVGGDGSTVSYALPVLGYIDNDNYKLI